MSTEFRVFHLLQIAHSALFRAADKRSRREQGLSSTQIAVLHILRRQDGLAISDIAAILAMGKSSLTGLIDRLCDREMITRQASDQDRRITLIHLTTKGKQTADQALRTTKEVNVAVLAPFSEPERAVIQRFLRHLANEADVIVNPPRPEHPDD